MICLTDIAIIKGQVYSTKELSDDRYTILNLLSRGATRYYKRDNSLFSDIEKCILKLKKTTGIKKILISTSSIKKDSDKNKIKHILHKKINEVAEISYIGENNCGDCIPLLSEAKNTIKQNNNSRTLIIIIDDIINNNIPRIVNNSYLHSDSVSMGIIENSLNGLNIKNTFTYSIKEKDNQNFDIYKNLEKLLRKTNDLIHINSLYFDSIITHNMNVLYIEYINKYINKNNSLVNSFPAEGHFLAADILHNMEKILKDDSIRIKKHILIAPTVSSVNIMDITKE